MIERGGRLAAPVCPARVHTAQHATLKFKLFDPGDRVEHLLRVIPSVTALWIALARVNSCRIVPSVARGV